MSEPKESFDCGTGGRCCDNGTEALWQHMAPCDLDWGLGGVFPGG